MENKVFTRHNQKLGINYSVTYSRFETDLASLKLFDAGSYKTFVGEAETFLKDIDLYKNYANFLA